MKLEVLWKGPVQEFMHFERNWELWAEMLQWAQWQILAHHPHPCQAPPAVALGPLFAGSPTPVAAPPMC